MIQIKQILVPFLLVVLILVAIFFLPVWWNSTRSTSHFKDLIPGKVASISMRSDENGVLYKTSNPQDIESLIQTLNSISYLPTTTEAVTGASTSQLFDQHGHLLGAFSLESSDIIRINGHTYRMEPNPETSLTEFYKKLTTDQNISK